MNAGLGTLIAPVATETFLENYWPNKIFTTSGPMDRFGDLNDKETLASAEGFLELYDSPVSLFRSDGFHSRLPNGKLAIPFYKNGFTCYLRDVDSYDATLKEMTLQVCQDLGFPPNAVKCEVFCSFGISGVGMHSDYDLNFQLLLRGKKRWRAAPNCNIVNQTNICLPSGRVQRDDFQLKLAHTLPLPERMPDGAITVDIEPGGVVFMPRGYWHQTESTGECFSLNFVVKGPHWISVLCHALENRLISDPEWREYAYGISGNQQRQQAAIGEFASLLQSLKVMLFDRDCRDLATTLVRDARLEKMNVERRLQE